MKVKDVLKTVKPTTRFRLYTTTENYLNNWDETAMEKTLFRSWSNAAKGVKDFYDEEVIQLRPVSSMECGYYVLDIQVKDKRYGTYDPNK